MLKRGDIIFFVPLKSRLKKIGIDHYVCTGILVVDRILENMDDLRSHPSINAKFVRLYDRDLRRHLRKDKPTTRTIRGTKIILGNSSKSVWFCKNKLNLGRALGQLGLNNLSSQLANQQVKAMTHGQAIKLCDSLRTKLPRIHDGSHNHLNRKHEGDCNYCFRNDP